MTAPPAFWGPAFPDYNHAGPCFFGPAFPDCYQDPTVVVPPGPSTAATAAFDWDNLTVRFEWPADIVTFYTGAERRAQALDLPVTTFKGDQTISWATMLSRRGQLARYAAQGKPFLIGLPHESIECVFAGAVATVPTTTFYDWLVPGQQVLALSSDRTTQKTLVVQSSTGTTITFDSAPGFALGLIMPAMPTLLDAEQSFQRYQAIGSLEKWTLSGRQVNFGYESGNASSAFAVLSGATAGYLTNAVVTFTTPGTIGNGWTLTLVGDTTATHGFMSVSGTAITFHFRPTFTTILDLLGACPAVNLQIGGSLPRVTNTLRATTDEFGPVTLAGGIDKNWGTMGAGATVTEYYGSPVWDRPLPPGVDGMHSMVEMLDLGGVPAQFQTATVPDWQRAVVLNGTGAADWQWFKAFLFACRGQQCTFWLPTWRADLKPITLIPEFLTVDSSIGDFTGWYPALRRQIQIWLSNGTIFYAEIIGQVDNGNGTRTLTISASIPDYDGGGSGPSTVPVLVSWLDGCRWESPTFEATWVGQRFAFKAIARAVQQ